MRVRVPADVDMADRIFAGLTARQLAILGAHGLVLWTLWGVIGRHLPPIVFGCLAIPIAASGLTWAMAKPEGVSVERLAAQALAHLRRPRRLVLAPDGISQAPSWVGPQASIGPLELPWGEASMNGHADLGAEGSLAVCRASAVNLSLRSETEQRALVDGFGRFLNSLDAPLQFVIRSGRADLSGYLEALGERAGSLAHPGLERAAREHAAFLRSLVARRDVLVREVLVCFREPGATTEATVLLDRRVDEATALLRGMGVRLTRLSGEEIEALLARSADPENPFPPLGSTKGIVEGRP